ncbi:TadE/TadG family type IV pilus assembly protein [Tianweitania sediminis]|uniref:Pilus assembly protein n=1 Tax=Tianweitania sediminis TaxID=1502156 RepID=A0A8J7UIX8_9HYPH|nr:TadE/TadG family type IV pilus assembly protein [Tianweitania sediminis]MBP0439398.1 pilus assembly protein [Tianweitania sediminis]
MTKPTHSFPRILTRFAHARNGNILITTALALPILIGMVALSVEYGGGLMKRVENQRVADLAAFAGATAYGAKSTEAAMLNAANNVARLNGLDPAAMTVTLVDSPRSAGTKAVDVDVATQQNLYFARVLGDFEQLQVKAGAVAEVGVTPSQPGCVYALSSSETGITMSGGTSLNASGCAVSSNTTMTVPCGTKIVTTGANYNTTVPNQPCNGIEKTGGGAAPVVKQATTDPLAGHTGIADAVARLTTVRSMTGPSAPITPTGFDIRFAYDTSQTETQAIAAGCTAARLSNNSWRLTCPTNKTTHSFRKITLGGGIHVDFNSSGPASTTYTFSDVVTNAGNSLTFGPGTFKLAKGLVTEGGSTTTFGAGTFLIGQSDSDCNGSGRYSICNTSTLTIGGPSTFELSAGVYNSGGATLTMGSGVLNSYKFGPSSTGNAVLLGGGSHVRMADATGVSSLFQVVGDFVSDGGSCFTIPAAAHHDIKGALRAAGGTTFGSGVYTVRDFLAFGANGGGSVWCNGANVAGTGVDVNFILGGDRASTQGTCNGYAFCVGSGFSGISLAAPKIGPLGKVLVVGPQLPANIKGATFAEGGSAGVLAGAFYFPFGPVTMSGGASAGGANNYCLQLIGSRITLGGGTTAVSECIAAGGGSAAKKVVLVQ